MNKEKRKQAIALSYDERKHNAPTVIAKGKGLIADQIIDKAKEHQVPIQEDSSLVELLSTLNINEQIPEDLYTAVAEVFSFIYSIEKETAKNEKNIFN
ncbi:MAG TPA: EscU/YscU/HrcU family type III secretion system export apparatus switch protein [Niallia sp.]|nr:EscU/YscU/HrcU family type III secretion system export apparatus switch protein [Niallia sp.]